MSLRGIDGGFSCFSFPEVSVSADISVGGWLKRCVFACMRMHCTTRPLTLIANVSFSLVTTTGSPSVLSLRQPTTDVVKFPHAPAIFDRELKMVSYRLNYLKRFFLMVWFLMLSRAPRCLWPLGKWKMEEEAGQQHDCGVYGCCGLNSCENSGMRRWGIFLSEIQCHCYWKITHTICVFPHRIAHLTLELKLFHPFTLLVPLNVICCTLQLIYFL